MVVSTNKNIEKLNKPNEDERFSVRSGDIARVYQIIKEKTKKKKGAKSEIKERIQIFEGLVIKKRHGNEIGGTITVRKIVSGIGVEKIFPIHSPKIKKIEIIKKLKNKKNKKTFILK